MFEAIVNPRIEVPSHLMQLMAKRDETMPLHSIRITQQARLREFINEPLANANDIESSYRITFNEVLALRERRRKLDSAFPPKARATFYIAYSVALSYGVVLSTIMLRTVAGFEQPFIRESTTLLDETLALTEAAAEFIPLGSSAMSTLLLAAWPNDPLRRPAIEEWLRKIQGGFPIARWVETAMWLDEMLLPPHVEEFTCFEKSARPSDACIVM